MNRKAGYANKLFHVKPLVPAAAATLAAALLFGCQAPAEEEPGRIDIDALENIALNLPYSELEQVDADPLEGFELPSPEEAEKATGIQSAEEGSVYAQGEVLVSLKGSADIADINQQLSLCDFIQENRIGNEMMVVGEIRDGKVKKGSSGEAVMLIHTAKDVQVNQALAGLREMNALKNSYPNYLLAAS